MSESIDQGKQQEFYKNRKQMVKVSNLLLETMISLYNPENILENLQEIINIVNNEWIQYIPALFGSTKGELLWKFLKDEKNLKEQPKIRDATVCILSHGASTALAAFNPKNILSSVENIMILLDIIVNPHNNDEKENAIILLKYLMKYTSKKLENEGIADYLVNNLDKICPSIIRYVVEKLSSMSESAANKLTNYLLNYIDKNHNTTYDKIIEQRSLALEAISFIPKASENHSQIYTLMEEYLQSDQQIYNESGLIVAQSVSLSIETIKNYLLKFLDSKNSSILLNTISALISSSSVWKNNKDCYNSIINKLNDLFNFDNCEIQDKSFELLSFADPTNCRITEEIIDTLIEMLATKSSRIFEITQILINVVSNIMKGELECGITLGEFQDKIWENETYINEALKGSQIAQEQYQKLAAILQSGAEY